MTKRFRLCVILFFLGISAWFLYPTVVWYFFTSQDKKELGAQSRQEMKDYAIAKGKEKLDELKELLSKNPQEAFPEALGSVLQKAKDYYTMDKVPHPSVWTIQDVFKAFSSQDALLQTIEDSYLQEVLAIKDIKNKIIQLGLDLSGGMSVVVRADLKSLEKKKGQPLSSQEKDDAISRAIEVLKTRIDQFGVSEPVIKREPGGERIFIELPGDVDQERVSQFLQGRGSLTMNIVDDEATSRVNGWMAQNPLSSNSHGEVEGIPSEVLPAGLAVRSFYKKDRFGIDQLVSRQVIKTEEKYVLDGIHIQSAQVGRDHISNRPIVSFSLDAQGSEHFFKMTQENVQKTMAVVLDDKIRAGALISSPISGGNVQVTGFSQVEAQDLSKILRTGALPVKLIVQSSTAIGSHLGQETIHAGLKATMWGVILVCGFMLLYYKGAGLNANVALMINMFIVLAVLSVFGMTLTLTAIASFVLTIGIAVDANVIVFERIKEEYFAGKSPATAIDIGFKRAFWTVLDSHITSLIAALFLSFLSKGAIQGFAVTLAIGLVSSMFTALFVSRLIFDFETDVLKIRKIAISWRKH